MLRCENDNHYLASPGFLALALHTLTGVAVPVHALGFYCILYKTPNQMRSVKWLLLNLHSWGVVLDVVVTFFAVPYAVFPAMAGYGLGPVDSPGLFLYLIVTIINTVSISIFVIFENQYHLLFGQHSWWSRVRKPVIVINYILNPLYFIPPQMMIPDQDLAREAVWKYLGCLPELPPNRQLFVLSLDTTVTAVTVIVCESVATVDIATFFVLNIYNLIYPKTNTTLSRRTIMMQRKLSIALIVQSASSLIWFIIPIQFVVAVITLDYHNQLLNNLVFVFVACHGISSTTIMILAHRPYRDFVLIPIRRLIRKVPVILVTASSSSLGA